MAKLSKNTAAVVEDETPTTETPGPVAVPDLPTDSSPVATVTSTSAASASDTVPASPDPSTAAVTPSKRRGRAPGTSAPPGIGWTAERHAVLFSTVAALNGQNKLYTYNDIASIIKSDPAFTPVADLVTGNAVASHIRQLKRKVETAPDGTSTKPWAFLDEVVNVFHKRGGPRKSHTDAANAAKALFGLA